MSSLPMQATPFPPLPVTGVGMCTSMGGVVGGCAAARAGIQRISEVAGPPVLDIEEPSPEGIGQPEDGSPTEDSVDDDVVEEEEEKVFWGHMARDLPDGSVGIDRLSHLGASALQDLLLEYPAAVENPGRMGLILCLPSGYLDWAGAFLSGEGGNALSSGVFLDPEEAVSLQKAKDTLIPALRSLAPDLPDPVWTGIIQEDQAGFAEGIGRAAALLSQGRLDSCLLGGIDSRLNPDMLKTLDEMGLLQTSDFPAGFLPGEAGAFIFLRAPGSVPDPLAWIEASARTAEAVHRFSESPPVADALSQTVRTALGGSDSGSRLLVFGSVNGSPWNSNEWGYLLTRVRALGAASQWFSVGSFGETGAATGSVAACMAVRGFARGYANADRALIVLSSESGRKGAVVMRTSTSTSVGGAK